MLKIHISSKMVEKRAKFHKHVPDISYLDCFKVYTLDCLTLVVIQVDTVVVKLRDFGVRDELQN